jgi:hypothetical protein
MKNIAGKTRKTDNPYASWTDPRSGWKYKLLKSQQGDNSLPYARWFVDVEGYGHDLGDEYVSKLAKGLVTSDDLVFDESVWATKTDFMFWVKGGSK